MNHKIYTHKQIRKNLKKDELRDFLERAITFAKTNTENLLISIIIVGVIAVLVPLYFKHQAENKMRAANMLERALSYYFQPLSQELAPTGAGFKTSKEKYQKSREAFAEVFGNYSNTKAARLAHLGEANSCFWLKQYDQSLAIYREDLGKYPKDFLAATVKERIAVCLQNLQKWKEAQEVYQEILTAQPQYFNRRAVHAGIARSQFHLGETDKAKAALKEEAALEPGSFWSEQARHQLAWYEHTNP